MRGIVKFLATLIVGIALIWLGFWWYAESRLQSGFTDWADRQAVSGWKISYSSIQRGTSPLNAAITITSLTLDLPPGPAGETAAISLPTVTLRIDALNPLVFHTDLPSKIGLAIGNNVDLVFSTGSIALAENMDPRKLFDRAADPFRGGDFSAGDIDILASAGSLLVLHIDKIASHDTLNPDAGPGDTAIFSKTAFEGLAVSPLLARIASLPFGGRITHLGFSVRLSGPMPANLPDLLDQVGPKTDDLRAQQRLLMPVIHQWAAQGGTGNAAASLILGPSTVHAAGSVKFDANLQPNGTADLIADHLDQFTAALAAAYPALQDDITRAEAQLSPYLTSTAQGGQTLTLHVTYGSPGIFVNGQKTAKMPPFDWNAAENPPPAPSDP